MEAAAAATKNHKKFMNDFVLYEFITGLNNTKNKEEIPSSSKFSNKFIEKKKILKDFNFILLIVSISVNTHWNGKGTLVSDHIYFNYGIKI